MNKPQTHKVVFLGDQSVGKTSIINRIMYEMFEENDHVRISHVFINKLILKPTVGIDFLNKTITKNNILINMQIWDTAGQERFRTLIPSYIRDSNIAILVFDLTSSHFINIYSI